METKEPTFREKMMTLMKYYGLEMDFDFVPFSRSRNKDEKRPSLNYKVHLYKVEKGTRTFIYTIDYFMGYGHSPSQKLFPNPDCVDAVEALKKECETGKVWGAILPTNKNILPDPVDVIECIILDTNALDFPTFEEWAKEFDFNPDSRKNEKMYRTCVEEGLALRRAIGDDGIKAMKSLMDEEGR